MEEAIKSTLKDVQDLEDQISAILASLKSDGLIEEATLLPLPQDVEASNNLGQGQGPIVRKRTGGGKTTASQKNRKSREMDSAPIPMDTSEFNVSVHLKSKDVFKLIESSVFIVPVLDELVYGMTLINNSTITQDIPSLLLNIIPQEIDVLDKPCRVFQYSVKSTLLDVKVEAVKNRNVGEGIPYHDTFDASKQSKVQPGCQVLLTATFQQPLNFLGIDNKFRLIVSVILNGNQLWSRKIPVDCNNLNNVQQNDSIFQIHQKSILTAISTYSEHFKMNRLLAQGDRNPHRAIEKFLTPFGFEKIFSEPIDIDSTVEILSLTKNPLSTFWGMTFKIEKSCRNINTIRYVASARSVHQFQIFLRLFKIWLTKERKQEKDQGLKGLSVLPMTSSTEERCIVKTLKNEIKVINSLIEMGQGSKGQSDFLSDVEWIEKFIPVVCETDDIFMNNISSKSKLQ